MKRYTSFIGRGLPSGLALGGGQLFFQFHDASVPGAQVFTHTSQFLLPDLALLAEGLIFRLQAQQLLGLLADHRDESIRIRT